MTTREIYEAQAVALHAEAKTVRDVLMARATELRALAASAPKQKPASNCAYCGCAPVVEGETSRLAERMQGRERPTIDPQDIGAPHLIEDAPEHPPADAPGREDGERLKTADTSAARVPDVVELVARLQAELSACAPYLKDGETPAERIERERKDNGGLMMMLAKEKHRTEQQAARINELHNAMQRLQDQAGADSIKLADLEAHKLGLWTRVAKLEELRALDAACIETAAMQRDNVMKRMAAEIERRETRIVEMEMQNATLRNAQKSCEDCDGPTMEWARALEADNAKARELLSECVAFHDETSYLSFGLNERITRFLATKPGEKK